MVDLSSPKTNNASSLNLRLQSSICTTPLFRNKAFLTQKYHVERLSARQIAVLIGCAHSTINNALETFGLAKQKHQGGWVPYGNKLLKVGRVPHVRQQKVIEWMLGKKRLGWSNAEIAAALNKRKVPSPACIGTWYPASVRKIIKQNNGL